jgi:LytS/YehU family sensor histidine kinase
MGWRGIALIVCGISVGFVLGTALGDAYSGTATGLLRGHDAVPSLLTEARLKLLEAQLEPHMMFNTLANLRVLIATDPPRAQAMLDHLIAYLRATLGGARAALHPLADEFARLADYLEIMAVRMGPRLAFALDLPEALRGVPVPPLLLQPLVENAIRHGLEPQVAGGHIGVRASTRPGPAGPCWCWKWWTPAWAWRSRPAHDTTARKPLWPGAGARAPGHPVRRTRHS